MGADSWKESGFNPETNVQKNEETETAQADIKRPPSEARRSQRNHSEAHIPLT